LRDKSEWGTAVEGVASTKDCEGAETVTFSDEYSIIELSVLHTMTHATNGWYLFGTIVTVITNVK